MEGSASHGRSSRSASDGRSALALVIAVARRISLVGASSLVDVTFKERRNDALPSLLVGDDDAAAEVRRLLLSRCTVAAASGPLVAAYARIES